MNKLNLYFLFVAKFLLMCKTTNICGERKCSPFPAKVCVVCLPIAVRTLFLISQAANYNSTSQLNAWLTLQIKN